MKKVLVGSLLLAALATGCTIRGSGYATTPGYVEVYSDPPPPRAYTYTPRDGYIYIDGRWDWRGGQWVWMNGRYERQRAGYSYSQGYWQQRGNRHVWVEGRWGGGNNDNRNNNNNRGPAERDHRSAPGQGPDVRDHRR